MTWEMYDRDVAEWTRQGLRCAIGCDATSDDAYRRLIEFDVDMCSEYPGFKIACSRVGLPYITAARWKRLLGEVERA